MSYQDDLLAFGREIFGCPHYREGGDCRAELHDVSNGLYKHGPEISFVGENFGRPGALRVLFTRLNPTWNQDHGWVGTRESVEEFKTLNRDANPRDIFLCYLKGWQQGEKVYRGMWDAGTVTGHPNKSRLPADQKRKSPRYGIQLIMEEMIRAGVFPMAEESPLQFCAINNVVKCAGKTKEENGKNWNPGSSMYQN